MVNRIDKRSWRQLVFVAIAGLTLVSALSGCGVILRTGVKAYKRTESFFYPGRHGDLTEKERLWAKIAWKYFENNLNYGTGLVNSSNQYPSASMWNTADYLAALVSVYELGLVDRLEFDRRLSGLLQFLNRMPLIEKSLPNLLYNTKTGAMVDYTGKQGELGWSARDIGRLLLWLKIVGERFPEFSEYCDKVVLRWNFCKVIDSTGQMYSAVKSGDALSISNDQRLGFEEYCARGYQAWGFNPFLAMQFEPFITVRYQNIELYADARDVRIGKAHSTITTLPYALDGLEFNWASYGSNDDPRGVSIDLRMKRQAERVYLVQERRFRNEKIFTARSDHLLSNDPYFVFDAVYADGYFWNTLTGAGNFQPQSALVSTAAVFGMWALWPTVYTDQLMELIEALYDPKQGWFEGRAEASGGYDRTISLATNAMVLESLFYKVYGPIYYSSNKLRYYDVQLQDQFKRNAGCFPKSSVNSSETR